MKKRKQRKNAALSHSNVSKQTKLASLFDPNGSYTGMPVPGRYPTTPDGDEPVQDVDDL